MDLLGHGWLEKTNCYAASLRAGRLLGWRGIEGEFALYNPPTQSPTPPRGVFPERPPPLPSNTWFFDITQQRRGSRSLVWRKERRNERRVYRRGNWLAGCRFRITLAWHGCRELTASARFDLVHGFITRAETRQVCIRGRCHILIITATRLSRLLDSENGYRARRRPPTAERSNGCNSRPATRQHGQYTNI